MDAVRTRSKLALEVVSIIMVSQVGNLEYVIADLCISLIDIVLLKFGFEDVAGFGVDEASIISLQQLGYLGTPRSCSIETRANSCSLHVGFGCPITFTASHSRATLYSISQWRR